MGCCWMQCTFWYKVMCRLQSHHRHKLRGSWYNFAWKLNWGFLDKAQFLCFGMKGLRCRKAIIFYWTLLIGMWIRGTRFLALLSFELFGFCCCQMKLYCIQWIHRIWHNWWCPVFWLPDKTVPCWCLTLIFVFRIFFTHPPHWSFLR